MNNIIDILIIAWLSLMTLRGLIADSNIFPRDKKFSWLIYSKHETELVRQALKEAGIMDYDKQLVTSALKEAGITRDDIKHLILKKQFEKDDHEINEEHLVEIISHFILRHEGKMQYGFKTPIQTLYYVSSVEASYDPIYLNWMCNLLIGLIMKKYESKELRRLPDFIITPKGGNTRFGLASAEKMHILFITSKYSLRSSYVSFLSGDSTYELMTNYEGFWELHDKQKECENSGLYGIVVDCNTATGEQIIDTMIDFNKLVSNSKQNIEPLEHAFTLYRSVDNSQCDVDKKFKEIGFALHRYFDLSEADKKCIVEKRGEKQRLNVYSKEDLPVIQDILSSIKQKATPANVES